MTGFFYVSEKICSEVLKNTFFGIFPASLKKYIKSYTLQQNPYKVYPSNKYISHKLTVPIVIKIEGLNVSNK